MRADPDRAYLASAHSGNLNGMPALVPYRGRGRREDAAREREVAGTLAALRRKLSGEPDAVPAARPRCDRCGYLAAYCQCPGGPVLSGEGESA